MERDIAATFVNQITNLPQREPSTIASVFSSIGAWVAILIGFVLLNVVLYAAQEFYHRSDVQQCEALASRLELMKKEIDTLEQSINSKLQQKQEIEQPEQMLKDPKKYYKTKEVYIAAYRRYSALIDAYNADLTATQMMASRYEQLIEKYNSGVEEYNNLAKVLIRDGILFPFLDLEASRSVSTIEIIR